MKNLFVYMTFVMFFFSPLLNAQEMKEIWNAKLPHDGEKVFDLNESAESVLISDEKTISMVNTNDGSVRWSAKFKEISANLRKVDEIIPMWDAGVIFIFERKMGKDVLSVISATDGKELWFSQKYQGIGEDNVVYIPEMGAFAVSTKEALTMIKTGTGEELWSTAKFKGVVGAYYYDKNDQTLVMLNYKPTALGALFAGFKNQLLKINMVNGDIVWESTYTGLVEKKVVTRDPVLKLWVQNGKIFLTLNGFQVYDYQTGTPVWSVAYDQSALDEIRRGIPSGYVGRKIIRSTVYNAIADPIIDGNDVYIFDMQGKKSQYVKKYDLNSGKLIWTSPELKQVTIAPNMYKLGDKIVVQVGGAAEVQAICENKVQAGQLTVIYYTRHIFYQNYKPYGVMAFNVSDGSQAWRSERFSKGVTNLFPYNDKVVVCSGKDLYLMDAASGKEDYEVPLKADNINLAVKIIDFGEDNLLIVGEKGISSRKKSDGSQRWAVRTKAGDFDGIFGNTAFFSTDRGDQFAIDCETGKFTLYDGRKGAKVNQTLDGEFIYVLEKKSLTKAATNQ